MIETIEIANQLNYAAAPVIPIIAWVVSIGSGLGFVWWENTQTQNQNIQQQELIKQRGIIITMVVLFIMLFFVFKIGREIINK
tara:strand:+ start:729 stop:977 length:249 start_codon:yes stop_codon:yes gene_type:complete